MNTHGDCRTGAGDAVSQSVRHHGGDPYGRPATPAPALRRFGKLMGLPVNLDMYDALPRAVLDRLADEVFAWLCKVDTLFDIQHPRSEVNLLDQGFLRPGEADPLIREVLAMCARLHHRTNGYFDVYASGRLDPSDYVQSWAIQQVSAMLTEAGAHDHRLQIGEDVFGPPVPGLPWQMRVQDLHRPLKIGWIQGQAKPAVATVRNHTLGERIRNPVTRRPASGLASVTVAGSDLGTATAYAMAAIAMGRAGLDWLSELRDHRYTAVDEEGRCRHGGHLPGVLLI